jgi:hypothetical protein
VLVPRTGRLRELGAPSCSRAGQGVGVSGSMFNRVREPNRVVGGAVHHCASPGAAERIQDGVLGGRAADTERRSFEARRPHASRSQQHTARGKPQARGAQRRRASVRRRPRKGTGSARERRVRGTQEAETITGRVRREATSRADATHMCAAQSNAHQERSRRDKERKKCSKGLDNCGHIEGVFLL